MAHTKKRFPSCPSNMQLSCLSVDLGCVLFINSTIFRVAFRQCTTFLLYFDLCISVVNNLLTTHIYAYFMYTGPGPSNHCSCKTVQHTPLIMYICHIQPLCRPCKTTPIHEMTTVQFYISSHSHKNQCLLEEDTQEPIVSVGVCT